MGRIIKPKKPGGYEKLLPAQKKVAKRLLEEELKKRKRNRGMLTGGQVKLDKNKDGEITGEDFKMMKEKKVAGRTYPKGDPRLKMDKNKKLRRKMKQKLMTAAGGGMMQDKMKMMGGGKVMKYSKGGKIDGVAIRGKTRGMVV